MIDMVAFMKSIAIYKVLIGEYEFINESVFKISEDTVNYKYSYFFITDREIQVPSPWNLIVIKKQFTSPAVENRFYKILVPDYFEKYDYTIYLDTNISILRSIDSLMDDVVQKDNEIYAYPHFRNTSVKQEIINCFIFSKITFSEMRKALKFFESNLHDLIGFECGVLIRETNKDSLRMFQKTWFDYYRDNVRRDQLYFMLSLKQHNLTCYSLGDNSFRSKLGCFKLHPHKEHATLLKKIGIAIKMKLYRYKKSDL